MNRALGSAIPGELWERLGAQELEEVLGRWRSLPDEWRRIA